MENNTHLKCDHSPAGSVADSFDSIPTSFYQPLFDSTMNPIEALTPQSVDGDSNFNCNMIVRAIPEKKPIKKRKSWGQQLPEPKTNLPPRKRAKTDDEKEQRRVERVLRNRRAAQSSRERKRQEVEALESEKRAMERENLDLVMRLADMEAKNNILQEELERLCGTNSNTHLNSYTISPSPRSTEFRKTSPVTLSQELFSFSNHNSKRSVSSTSHSTQSSRTIDPASLSPESQPFVSSSSAESSDMIQHPAVSVGRKPALDQFEVGKVENDYTIYHGDLHVNNNNNNSDNTRCYNQSSHSSEQNTNHYEESTPPFNENFSPEYDPIDGRYDGIFQEFVLCDYFNEESRATDIQCPNVLAETAACLQSQFGASSLGCDGCGIAVRV